MTTLNLTQAQTDRLRDILEHQFLTSVNHLVSSVDASVTNPDGEWARSARRLAGIVETDRKLKIDLERAIIAAQEDPIPETAKDIKPIEGQINPTVAVQFEVSMFVHVDLVTGLPTQTIVQTPYVTSMQESIIDCVRYGPDIEDTLHHPARWGRAATETERAEAIKILDNNEWPAPELVS